MTARNQRAVSKTPPKAKKWGAKIRESPLACLALKTPTTISSDLVTRCGNRPRDKAFPATARSDAGWSVEIHIPIQTLSFNSALS